MKHYDNFDDDLKAIGWALVGFGLVILCLLGFIITELANG